MEELQSYNRRSFIKSLGTTFALSALAGMPSLVQGSGTKAKKLTILHTNDVHSQIEPFAMNGSRYQGLGGAARRSTLVKTIRGEEKNVLLLDAGDMFQGTPYFNLFGGALELELMSKMKYDVGTFGNHEFDNGIPGLLKHFDKANFPFVTSNYDFADTALAGKTRSHVVLEKDGIRIGIFGLCKDLEGLSDPKSYKGMKYLDPIKTANEIIPRLKNEHRCHLIICLSHLGYDYEDKRVISDLTVAANTKDIDLIIGGHTHTLLKEPTEVRNLDNKVTLVNQVGYGGAYMGRVDFVFGPKKGSRQAIAYHYELSADYDGEVLV